MSRNEKNRSTAQMADKNWFILRAAVIVCFAFAVAAQAGTDWLEKAKILASDGTASDFFGKSVSISGDLAIVGAYLDDEKGDGSGSAYIFRREDANWVQQQELTASDGAAGDNFGISVSISGDYAIVGALYNDSNGVNSGSAYTFKLEDANWVQQQNLTASDAAAEDNFGVSVSISGDYAIVGAYYDDDKGSNSGSAYIFKRDGTSWSEQAKLLASDGAVGDLFGYSVSISGDYAIVGSHADDSYKGSAYVFKRDGTSWSQQAKITASDGAADDYFGVSVSISGDLAIVGAFLDDDKGANSGSAYVFKRDGTSWSEQAKLLASDGAADDYFGVSVSISGDYAIVGAYVDDSYKGSAYIFRGDGTSWVQQAKILASDGAADDTFGCSVCISDDWAIVAASHDDNKEANSGSAYIFNRFCPKADLDDNCKVDFADFAIFADEWLYGTD